MWGPRKLISLAFDSGLIRHLPKNILKTVFAMLVILFCPTTKSEHFFKQLPMTLNLKGKLLTQYCIMLEKNECLNS